MEEADGLAAAAAAGGGASSGAVAAPSAHEAMSAPWDPFGGDDRAYLDQPSPEALRRVMLDLHSIYADPSPGICVVNDDGDAALVHALLIGLEDTPYEGGLFHFVLRCPSDYPYRPPRVKLCTTGHGTVRFNPNLYANGKVCLSILGTWKGPEWQPVLSIGTVLMSIQTLMHAEPYRNEPGFEVERSAGDVRRYNHILVHETLRVAVCDMVENKSSVPMPEPLLELARSAFSDSIELYEELVEEHKHLDGQPMIDPFTHRSRGTFHFERLLERIRALARQYPPDADPDGDQ